MVKGAEQTMDNGIASGIAAGVGGVGIVEAFRWLFRRTKMDGAAEVKEKADAERSLDLRQDIHELKEEMKGGNLDVRRIADSIAMMQGSQNAFNATTTKAIDVIFAKLDRHDEAIHALMGAVNSRKDQEERRA